MGFQRRRIVTRMMLIAGLALAWAAASPAAAAQFDQVSEALAQEKGCLSCYEGIERFSDGAMQDTIESIGAELDDPGGCVVCHGGTPAATAKDEAHA